MDREVLSTHHVAETLALLGLWVFFGIPFLFGFGYLVYLFVEVVYLGGSNACPQNLC